MSQFCTYCNVLTDQAMMLGKLIIHFLKPKKVHYKPSKVLNKKRGVVING